MQEENYVIEIDGKPVRLKYVAPKFKDKEEREILERGHLVAVDKKVRPLKDQLEHGQKTTKEGLMAILYNEGIDDNIQMFGELSGERPNPGFDKDWSKKIEYSDYSGKVSVMKGSVTVEKFKDEIDDVRVEWFLGGSQQFISRDFEIFDTVEYDGGKYPDRVGVAPNGKYTDICDDSRDGRTKWVGPEDLIKKVIDDPNHNEKIARTRYEYLESAMWKW